MELRRHLGLDQVHLLGQSWGGMLAIEYLCDYQPEGVTSVILSSTLSSASLWAKEQHRMIRFLSREDQEAIAEAERHAGVPGSKQQVHGAALRLSA